MDAERDEEQDAPLVDLVVLVDDDVEDAVVEDALVEVWDEEVAALWEGEHISVVVPGDVDGWANLVCRNLGGGDGAYEGRAVEIVMERQIEHGLDPTGIVSGSSWALVLPKLSVGAMGQEVSLLRKLLGMRQAGSFNETVVAEVSEFQIDNDLDVEEVGTVDTATWRALIEGYGK